MAKNLRKVLFLLQARFQKWEYPLSPQPLTIARIGHENLKVASVVKLLLRVCNVPASRSQGWLRRSVEAALQALPSIKYSKFRGPQRVCGEGTGAQGNLKVPAKSGTLTVV